MKERYILLSGIIIVVLALVSFKATYALFSDTASSTSNTFSAAAVFPTGSPTPTSTPTGSPTPTGTPSPTQIPEVNPGDVVINEIMWMGGANNKSSDEWVELRNMTGNTIELSNWIIEDLGSGINDITIPNGESIAPNGFFLIANDPKETSMLNVDPDVVIGVGINNNGEQFVLKTPASVVIDTAGVGATDWFAGTNTPEASMERNNIPGDGAIAGNWHTATSATNIDPGSTELASPKATNSTP